MGEMGIKVKPELDLKSMMKFKDEGVKGNTQGVEFLLKVKELQPEAIRILLTAYADKENAIRAINEVGLYQYVEKPWDNDALLLLIRNGLLHGKLWKQNSGRAH